MTRRGTAAAVLTVVAVACTPALPWHVAPALLGLAALGVRDPHWIWPALGACVVWGGAASGPAAPAVITGALLLGVRSWRSLSTALVFVAGALVVKQYVVAPELGAATAPVAWLVGGLLAAAGGVSSARGTRVEAGALGFAGLVVFARLARVWTFDGVERLDAAVGVDAVGMVYDGLEGAADPELLIALVRAAPERDAAALRLGVDAALDAGWRPARADGRVIEVARALEARGRGGEALRLLARHPRDGENDALRALLERIQGVPVRWRGAAIGPTLPGRFDPGVVFETNGWQPVEFTATEALARVTLEGDGSAWEEPPAIEVTLDAGQPARWLLDGPGRLVVDGPIEPGPHRIGLRFVNDGAGAGGDRNARVTSVTGP